MCARLRKRSLRPLLATAVIYSSTPAFLLRNVCRLFTYLPSFLPALHQQIRTPFPLDHAPGTMIPGYKILQKRPERSRNTYLHTSIIPRQSRKPRIHVLTSYLPVRTVRPMPVTDTNFNHYPLKIRRLIDLVLPEADLSNFSMNYSNLNMGFHRTAPRGSQ